MVRQAKLDLQSCWGTTNKLETHLSDIKKPSQQEGSEHPHWLLPLLSRNHILASQARNPSANMKAQVNLRWWPTLPKSVMPLKVCAKNKNRHRRRREAEKAEMVANICWRCPEVAHSTCVMNN